nr:MAG TPA: hypothetical protein [Caudoviricetes sp.]
MFKSSIIRSSFSTREPYFIFLVKYIVIILPKVSLTCIKIFWKAICYSFKPNK